MYSVPNADVTHTNLNDGVIEGLAFRDIPAFSVQHHPEAGPGPHESAELFDDFDALLRRVHRSTGSSAAGSLSSGKAV